MHVANAPSRFNKYRNPLQRENNKIAAKHPIRLPILFILSSNSTIATIHQIRLHQPSIQNVANCRIQCNSCSLHHNTNPSVRPWDQYLVRVTHGHTHTFSHTELTVTNHYRKRPYHGTIRGTFASMLRFRSIVCAHDFVRESRVLRPLRTVHDFSSKRAGACTGRDTCRE